MKDGEQNCSRLLQLGMAERVAFEPLSNIYAGQQGQGFPELSEQ
jgi:hypothetical protein